MPVSTRAAATKARGQWEWPPQMQIEGSTGGAGSSNKRSRGSDTPRPTILLLTLPSALYWSHVRPYTPPEDRAIVTRDCSTRFPPSDSIRSEIDVEEWAWTTFNDKVKYYRIPKFEMSEWSPGDLLASWTGEWREEDRVTDPARALEMLQAARKQWDDHVASFDSSAERLKICLDVVYGDTFGGKCPLLFPGDGGIQAIIDYHIKTDPRAIGTSPIRNVTPGTINTFPQTILGHFVHRFLEGVWEDCSQQIHSCQMGTLGGLLDKLFKDGADIEGFLDPVIEMTEKVNCSGGLFYFDDFFISLLDNMKAKLPEVTALEGGDDYDEDGRVNVYADGRIATAVKWIIGEIESAKNRRIGKGKDEESERAWVKVGVKLGYDFD